MHGFAIGNKNKVRINMKIILNMLNLDNVLGYILGALCTFMGARLSFEDKICFNNFNLNVENVLSNIKAFRPTIYAR